MNFCSFIWGAFLVFAIVEALPTDTVEQESGSISNGENVIGKVREKRKIATATPAKPAVESIQPAELDPTAERPAIPVMKADEVQDGVRVKKQVPICAKPQSTQLRNSMISQPAELLVMKNEPLEPVRMTSKSMQRTFEPILSFGPISMSQPHGYGAQYSSMPVMSTSLLGQATYGPAPAASYQYQPLAAIPSLHRHPVYQHTAITLRQPSFADLTPEVYYYDGKQGDVAAQSYNDEPISLYCEPIRSASPAKTLSPAEEQKVIDERKLNITKTEGKEDEQVAKVNQIKEEITQLNKAAQRIVQQQEQLARMHQDNLARSSAMGLPSPMGYQYPSFSQYGQMPYYYSREEEVPKVDDTTQVPPPDSSTVKPVSQQQKPVYSMENQQPLVLPEMQARTYIQQQPYYGPSYVRSETGFNTGGWMRAAPAPAYTAPQYAATPEDVEFFMRMLNVGKKMGVIAKDYQPSLIKPTITVKSGENQEDKPHKSENALSDLAFGPNQKKAGDEDVKPAQDDDNKEVMKSRRDSRSLVMKS